VADLPWVRYDKSMVTLEQNQIVVALLGLVLLAILAAMLMAWGWLIVRLFNRQPVFPEQPLVPPTEPPWGWRTVLLTVLVYVFVGVLVAEGYALASGRFPVRGGAKPAAKEAPPRGAGLAAVAEAPEPPKLAMTEIMFVNAATNVILLIVFPAMLLATSRARLRDLGISGKGWWRQIAAGVMGMLIATPVVWAIQVTSVRIWKPHGHPLEQMLQEQFTFDVGYLAFITAVILAPLFEEMTFRGIIQRWLIKAFKRRASLNSQPDSLADPVFDCVEGSPGPESWEMADPAMPHGPASLCPQTYEPGFDAHGATRPAELATLSAAKNPTAEARAVARAIVVTSLIFAGLHAPQWPAPIAIFVLSLGLGTLAYRTGSLLAPVTMHACFNGLSTLLLYGLLLSGAGEKAKKAELPDAGPKPAACAPWLPR
jgi:membrane protease YdiL (CAAX protease family)